MQDWRLRKGCKLSQACYSVNDISTHWYEDKNSYHCEGDVGRGEERRYCKEHALPCGCGMPTWKHEAFWVIWPKNSPNQTPIALPIDDVRHKNLLEMGHHFPSRNSSCSLLLHYWIRTDLLSRPSQQLIGQQNSDSQVPYQGQLPKPSPWPLLIWAHGLFHWRSQTLHHRG